MVVTLRNIAKKTGVDVSVVSRVLNNKGDEFRISKDRQDRVKKTAKALGYVPNLSAQSVRKGSFGCAALLLSSYKERSYLPHRVLDGIHDELENHDLHLLLAKLPDETPYDPSKPPKIFRTLLADGLLVNYVRGLSSEFQALIDKNDAPTIWMNVKRDADCVRSNSHKAAYMATERLIELGHKKIAYFDWHHPDINLPTIHYSARDRYVGYMDAMAGAKLEPIEIRTNDVEAISKLLSRPERPTAFILYWSTCIPVLLKALRMAGLSVPRDISIITLTGQSYLEEVSVSAMVEPDYEIGRQAVEMLLEKIQDKTVQLPSRVLEFSYVDFGTCAPPGR